MRVRVYVETQDYNHENARDRKPTLPGLQHQNSLGEDLRALLIYSHQEYIYILLKIDKTNHKKEKDQKSHHTRAKDVSDSPEAEPLGE